MIKNNHLFLNRSNFHIYIKNYGHIITNIRQKNLKPCLRVFFKFKIIFFNLALSSFFSKYDIINSL